MKILILSKHLYHVKSNYHYYIIAVLWLYVYISNVLNIIAVVKVYWLSTDMIVSFTCYLPIIIMFNVVAESTSRTYI